MILSSVAIPYVTDNLSASHTNLLLAPHGGSWPGFRSFGTTRSSGCWHRLLDELLRVQIPTHVCVHQQSGERRRKCDSTMHGLRTYRLTALVERGNQPTALLCRPDAGFARP